MVKHKKVHRKKQKRSLDMVKHKKVHRKKQKRSLDMVEMYDLKC